MNKHINHKSNLTLNRLVEGNVTYAKNHSVEFEPLKAGQSPKVTLLTCCDSRVPQSLFNIDAPGEIFTVRNIGNQYENSEGSVKYPIIHLHTPLLVIVGHTGCGAIKASLSDYRVEDKAIQREVIGLADAIRMANQSRDMAKITDENQRLAVYAQINVDYQVNKTITDSGLNKKILNKELNVVGMVFDIHGVFGGELGGIYITNVNGKTELDEMKKQEIALNIEPQLQETKFKRM